MGVEPEYLGKYILVLLTKPFVSIESVHRDDSVFADENKKALTWVHYEW